MVIQVILINGGNQFSGTISGGAGVDGSGSSDPGPKHTKQNSSRPGLTREKGKFKVQDQVSSI